MEISTNLNLNLGTVSADLEIDGRQLMEAVDIEDIGTRMQPWIEFAVEREVGDIDWDFVDDMIRDRLRDGIVDDIVSDAVANSSTEAMDGDAIAADLLRQYLGRDALGNSDETGCDLASSFERAVRLANQRNTRSSEGAGMAAQIVVLPAIHELGQRLAALEQIVRRLTMADRNHAAATDLISSTLIGAPIHPPTDTDNTITDNTAAVLG